MSSKRLSMSKSVSKLKEGSSASSKSPSQGHKVLPKEVSFRVREKSVKEAIKPRLRAGSSFRARAKRVDRDSIPATLRKSLPPEPDIDRRFQGHWISERAEGADAFLSEMEMTDRWRKLAERHAGAQMETLIITQRGDYFEITDQNARRDICTIFEVGSSFKSENERGEEVTCTALWEDETTRDVLIIHAKREEKEGSPPTRVVLRRWVEPDGTMKQALNVLGKENPVMRTFIRIS